jgi:site-specific DNA-methyltransferase (adenine-specific)
MDGGAAAAVVNITAPSTDAAKQWQGWGTALKPAHEPIVLARKPLDGTVANNVLTHGVGGINIDDCRVGTDGATYNSREALPSPNGIYGDGLNGGKVLKLEGVGRWPANFIHDGSDEVLELFPDTASTGNGTRQGHRSGGGNGVSVGLAGTKYAADGYADGGSAARFFYCAKANKTDRNEGLDDFAPKRDADRLATDGAGGENPRNRTNTAKVNHHPTVKPTTLMRYLIRLVTPPHGTILDPFTGSGSTGKAAVLEGFNFIGIELDPDYIAIAEARIQHAYNQRH